MNEEQYCDVDKYYEFTFKCIQQGNNFKDAFDSALSHIAEEAANGQLDVTKVEKLYFD